jgi:hypothetical protein
MKIKANCLKCRRDIDSHDIVYVPEDDRSEFMKFLFRAPRIICPECMVKIWQDGRIKQGGIK